MAGNIYFALISNQSAPREIKLRPGIIVQREEEQEEEEENPEPVVEPDPVIVEPDLDKPW